MDLQNKSAYFHSELVTSLSCTRCMQIEQSHQTPVAVPPIGAKILEFGKSCKVAALMFNGSTDLNSSITASVQVVVTIN